MRRIFVGVAMLAATSTACAFLLGQANPTPPPVEAYNSYEGIDPSRLGAHASRFSMDFQGEEEGWRYEVTARYAETLTEQDLRIEGVEDAVNPGAVRMVTEGGVSRMIGPGTDGQCLQFPEDREVNVSFLDPDDVFAPEALAGPLVGMGAEVIEGQPAQQFALIQEELDGWEDVQLGIWIDPGTGAVLRYQFQAVGWDPYFRAGWGRLEGEFEVTDIGPQSIEPIAGCEVDLPLPADHRALVILPGVVAYETPAEIEAITDFYRSALAETAWQRISQEDRESGAVVLSYRDGPSTLDITIRRMDEFTRVELLTEGP